MLNPGVRKVLDWAIGITLILLGIAGWLIPVLPGWIFVLAGLAVLSSHNPWARALHTRFQRIGRSVRDKIVARPAEPSDGEGGSRDP